MMEELNTPKQKKYHKKSLEVWGGNASISLKFKHEKEQWKQIRQKKKKDNI